MMTKAAVKAGTQIKSPLVSSAYMGAPHLGGVLGTRIACRDITISVNTHCKGVDLGVIQVRSPSLH